MLRTPTIPGTFCIPCVTVNVTNPRNGAQRIHRDEGFIAVHGGYCTLFEDPKIGEKSCLLGAPQWQNACRESGFNAAQVYGLPHSSAEDYRQSLNCCICRATARRKFRPPKERLIADEYKMQQTERSTCAECHSRHARRIRRRSSKTAN